MRAKCEANCGLQRRLIDDCDVQRPCDRTGAPYALSNTEKSWTRMQNQKRYVGIDNDLNGGMTDTGKIIRDAWVFGIIPETETCEGWLAAGIEDLWRKVNAEWEKHGFLVGNLPPEL